MKLILQSTLKFFQDIKGWKKVSQNKQFRKIGFHFSINHSTLFVSIDPVRLMVRPCLTHDLTLCKIATILRQKLDIATQEAVSNNRILFEIQYYD